MIPCFLHEMASLTPSLSTTHGQTMAENVSLQSKVVMKHFRCIQLEKDNYYSRVAQFSAMLERFELMPYVEGNVDLDSSPIAWQHYKLIVSWILTGISPSILPQVVSFRTFAGVWLCLQWMYSSATETQQMNLRF